MIFKVILAAAVLGSAVYCVLTILAAKSYLSVRPKPSQQPAISVLKPLSGLEEHLAENLRSFFEQDYGEYEILFAVRELDDPALGVLEELRDAYPSLHTRVIVTGQPPYPNAKVYSLDSMVAAAEYDLLVMSDSDIRVGRDFLRVIAGEFEDPKTGLVTCPYRAVPSPGVGSTLEALGLNTQFLGGVLVARMLEGMKFALGPTIAVRRAVLEDVGGFDSLKDFLAEDFVMGNRAAAKGHGVILSSYVIGHYIGGHDLRGNLHHRLRWCRSTRRSRPAGYFGELFTMPLPLALLMLAVAPSWWPLPVVSIALRAASAWACAGWVLHDRLTARLWWMLPLQDVLAFLFWIAGFFGNTILWRGHRYRLHSDGRFEPIGN